MGRGAYRAAEAIATLQTSAEPDRSRGWRPPVFILLSPAKSLVEPPGLDALPHTAPELLEHSAQLIPSARAQSPADLRALMGISEDLATLNHARFQAWSPDTDLRRARQAALCFNGDVYQGLAASTLAPEHLDWAQPRVGILSGLYGLLRPLDAMQPYRLEMGISLANPRGANLYAFWGDLVTDAVARRAAALDDGSVLNLASAEYFKVIRPTRLPHRVVTPVFQDVKDGKARVLAFFAKRARGTMARLAITQRLDRAEDLKDCVVDGYAFAPRESTDVRWVFQRPQPPPVSRR